MRKNKFFILLLILGIIQTIINTNILYNFTYFDFIYIIIFYISIKLEYKKAIVISTLLGILTDYLSMGILGIFGLSRAISSYFINTITKYFDISKDKFLITIFLISFVLSNFIANIFFVLIIKSKLSLRIIFIIPILTTILNYILFKIPYFKKILNVNN